MPSLLASSSPARGRLARHDHGSQYASDYVQVELKFLGMVFSPAFVRVLRQEETGDGQ